LRISFAVFALFAIVFGFMRVGQNLKLTFAASTNPQEETAVNQEAFQNVKLRVTDTDEDGLSDWDELNTYGTSPYLSDTDSDGISDSTEIKNQTDPNCPEGRDCGSGIFDSTDATGTASNGSEATLPDGQSILPEVDTGISDKSIESLSAIQGGQNLSPSDIRSLLLEAGVSEEDLAGASDEDLINLFNDVTQNQP